MKQLQKYALMVELVNAYDNFIQVYYQPNGITTDEQVIKAMSVYNSTLYDIQAIFELTNSQLTVYRNKSIRVWNELNTL